LGLVAGLGESQNKEVMRMAQKKEVSPAIAAVVIIVVLVVAIVIGWFFMKKPKADQATPENTPTAEDMMGKMKGGGMPGMEKR